MGQWIKAGLLATSAFGIATAAQAQGTAAEEPAQEIIVTAQKTAQNLQDVPLSVSVVGGETLSEFGASKIQDIAATVPALQVNSAFGVPGSYSLTLRGITTGLNTNSTVATYIDDVPLGSSGAYGVAGIAGLDLLPYDLDHVEVLEGPQGTLYGASSMGGLLKYVTRTPSLSENSYRFGGDVTTVGYGDKFGWAGRGRIELVLAPETLSIGISGSHQYTPGYVNNVATGKKDINHGVHDTVRGVIHWRPDDALTVKIQGIYDRSNFKGYGSVAANADGSLIYGPYKVDTTAPTYNRSLVKLISAAVDYDFGFATLSSISSYTYSRNVNSVDASQKIPIGFDSAFVADTRIRKFTQEIRLASPVTDRFHWMIGAFYTNERTDWDTTGVAYFPGTTDEVPGLNPLLVTLLPSKYRERAVFGNATFNITDNWDVSGGIRYSSNRQRVSQYATGALLGGAVIDLGQTPSKDSATTFSVSTSYKVTPDAMLYARVASGYRPGGPNFALPGVPLTYDPDRLTNYEVGVKSKLFDNRLTFNLAAFYIEWNDILLLGTSPIGLAFIANGEKATSKGVELTSSVKVARGLTIGGALSYTDAKLEDDAPIVGGRDGDQLPYTAHWAAALTADYTTPVGDDTDARFGMVWRYTGPADQQFPNAPEYYRLRAYSTLDIKAGIAKDAFSLNLFIRNLADSHRFTSRLAGYNPVALQPRTIGLSLDVKLR